MKRIALGLCVALACAAFSAPEAKAQTQAGYCANAAMYYSEAATEAYNAYAIAKNATAQADLLDAYNHYTNASNDMYTAYQLSFTDPNSAANWATKAINQGSKGDSSANAAYSNSSGAAVHNYINLAEGYSYSGYVAAYYAGGQ